jgi:hypothetical protein
LAWELGGGLGHTARLRPLAADLLARGCRVVLATPRRVAPDDPLRALAGKGGLRVVRTCPLCPDGPEDGRRQDGTTTLADGLAAHGLADPGRLFPVAERWHHVLMALRPDLVIADYAPVATLVARGRVPVLTVGSGFTVPPAGGLLPPIRPWDGTVPPASRTNEARVLEACAIIARANGLGPPDKVADLLRGDEARAFTVPLLDPYIVRRAERVWPPYSV